MKIALKIFDQSLEQTKAMSAFYTHATTTLRIPHEDVSDILRFQHVYAVSALDRLIHELVSIGCIEIFLGKRIPTKKFLDQGFSADTLMRVTQDIKEELGIQTIIENASSLMNHKLRAHLKTQSFQAPEKINDALCYIWQEDQRFYKIADRMGVNGNNSNEKSKNLKTELTLIVSRRNSIAHEADIEPTSQQKQDISISDVESVIRFISSLGHTITDLVTEDSCYTKV